MNTRQGPSVGRLILGPAVITLGVTLLRLVGELLDWSPALFSREAGGGGALVGIAWLVPVFGVLFGVQLARAGHGPERFARALGFVLLGVALMPAFMFGAVAAGLMDPQSFSLVGLLGAAAVSLAGLMVAARGWPALGRVLAAYGLAARVPVAVVMLLAMLGDWKTHYDAPPPNFPEMAVFPKWVLIGFVPQLTIWIWYTVGFGMLLGVIAGAVAGRRARA